MDENDLLTHGLIVSITISKFRKHYYANMIRQAHVEDMPEIVKVLESYFLTLLPDQGERLLDKRFGSHITLSNQIVEYNPEQTFVALHENKIVGCAHYHMLDAETAKTTILTVLPEARKLGFGKELQKARMQQAYECGAKLLFTSSEHPDSIAWYQKHFAYRIVGEQERSHDLYLFRLPNQLRWGLHYGFTEYPLLQKMECDLESFFSKK